MTASKKFHLGDLLSITDGRLVSPVINGRTYPLEGVYEILEWMTGEELYTHALPRAGDSAKPVLLAEYPWLSEIVFPGVPDDIKTTAEVNVWISEWMRPYIERYGEYHDVWPIHRDDYEPCEPLDEPILNEMKGKIIPVNIDSEEDTPSPYGNLPNNS